MQNILSPGFLAVGFAFLKHQYDKKRYCVHAKAICENKEITGLKLKQLVVFFRHGARTPIHSVHGLDEVPYNPELVMSCHTPSMFPYLKYSSYTGECRDYSDYEKQLQFLRTRGGSTRGSLTSYGAEQMYTLGLNLREKYCRQLDLSEYSPQEVFVMSSNIRRTVLSARSVLAGFFGSDKLYKYAKCSGPVPIYVSECPNILIPDTDNCCVLHKTNKAAMLHADDILNIREDRDVLQEKLTKIHDEKIHKLNSSQIEIQSLLSDRAKYDTSKPPSCKVMDGIEMKINAAFKQRNDIAESIEHFWLLAFRGNPKICKMLSPCDHEVLKYLKRVEISRPHWEKKTVYRFYFDKQNPYFENEVIVKEVLDLPECFNIISRESEVTYKYGYYKEALVPVAACPCPEACETKEPKSPCAERCPRPNPYCSKSFLGWLLEPMCRGCDNIGNVLVKEVYNNPLPLYEVGHNLDPRHALNFVFLYDDLKSRIAHGYNVPDVFKNDMELIHMNAQEQIYQAMTGQTEYERPEVVKLSVGLLVSDILQKLQAKICNSESDQKLIFYSSHDSTLVALLEALDVWDSTWPPFASHVCFELYQDAREKYFIRVLYNEKALKIRGQCTELIPFETFSDVMSSFSVSYQDWNRLCKSRILEEKNRRLLHSEDKSLDAEERAESKTPTGM